MRDTVHCRVSPQHYTALQALLAPAARITMRYAPEVDWADHRGWEEEQQE